MKLYNPSENFHCYTTSRENFILAGSDLTRGSGFPSVGPTTDYSWPHHITTLPLFPPSNRSLEKLLFHVDRRKLLSPLPSKKRKRRRNSWGRRKKKKEKKLRLTSKSSALLRPPAFESLLVSR